METLEPVPRHTTCIILADDGFDSDDIPGIFTYTDTSLSVNQPLLLYDGDLPDVYAIHFHENPL